MEEVNKKPCADCLGFDAKSSSNYKLCEKHKKERDKNNYRRNYLKNRDEFLIQCKERYQRDKEKINAYVKEYHKKHLKRINELCRIRRANNPLLRIKLNQRTRISKAFKRMGYGKNTKSKVLLGAEWADVKLHIESLFKEGMSWDNYGKWHIDHIIPLNSAKTEDQLISLFNYKNLQPLWATENIKKGHKFLEEWKNQ